MKTSEEEQSQRGDFSMGHAPYKTLLTRAAFWNSCSSVVTADRANNVRAEGWLSLSGVHVVADCRI